MTGWLIFGGIMLLIFGILMIPVHVTADYKEELSVKIRFLFFVKMQIIPQKKRKKKPEEQKEEAKKPKKQEPKKQKRKKTLVETVDMVIDVVNKYGPGAKMILRNIRFHRLELFWKVGAEDAAACGIKYGKVCAWLNGALGFFRNFMKIEKAKFRIFPDFICEKDEIYGGADIEFNPLIVIIGALRMAVVFLKDMFGKMRKQNKRKKRAAKARRNIKAKESA